jgi:hypothetical protein
MHARPAQACEALGARRCSRQDAGQARPQAGRHDHPRQTVEHPFGTLKAWVGSTHFLTKTLEKVRTEMSLQGLAYNLKRMIKIFGVKPLLNAIVA